MPPCFMESAPLPIQRHNQPIPFTQFIAFDVSILSYCCIIRPLINFLCVWLLDACFSGVFIEYMYNCLLSFVHFVIGVRPYRCDRCEKAFTQRCSLESHSRKVHGVELQFAYKQRRPKTYVCEECGHTASQPQIHYAHLRRLHPYSPALARSHDKRLFKFAATESPPAE